ncbi:MAG TPA: NADH:flavin oxidoreductase [Polyangiaceae bacterium]|jgi:2,4-dienoyl-CoA reductase-like NADH-dependent reductase (Old Yellow Enzyme family)|nr:NADH:flavin oxidoreductase [Polyangiaceae bacterium]
MIDLSPLFTPFTCKSLRLANRFAMAPMTRTRSPSGVPTDDVVAYYERRAAHGVGLIVTEGTTVEHAVATLHPDVPRFWGEESRLMWKAVATAVHAEGGSIVPQLWHVGSARRPGTHPFPEETSIGPSGLVAPGKKKIREMTDADIADVIEAFSKSARYAKELGFDGLELHGAHGYLIDQFFWDGLNERAAPWGGSLAERTRFATEIVKACRREVGEDFAIILRFSQWKQQDYTAKLARTPGELETFLAPLVASGVDVFHCSTRRFWLPEFEGSELGLAGWTKKLSGKPTILVGSVGLDQEFIGAFGGQGAAIRSIDELVPRFEQGEFDLVAVGRALLQDPEWVEKLREGRAAEIRPFDAAALATLY